jgi:hypothetical protein
MFIRRATPTLTTRLRGYSILNWLNIRTSNTTPSTRTSPTTPSTSTQEMKKENQRDCGDEGFDITNPIHPANPISPFHPANMHHHSGWVERGRGKHRTRALS